MRHSTRGNVVALRHRFGKAVAGGEPADALQGGAQTEGAAPAGERREACEDRRAHGDDGHEQQREHWPEHGAEVVHGTHKVGNGGSGSRPSRDKIAGE